MSNKIIYLYLKESPLGLKYLGVTTNDPYKYMGSGQYWKKHLKKHNFKAEDIATDILLQTNDKAIVKFFGLYYSKIYNIVESEEWANLIPESGEFSTLGYKHSKESLEKLRIASTGRIPSKETRIKISNNIKKALALYGKSEKQKECARNVWKGKKLPAHILKAIRDAHSIKVVHKTTGIIYDCMADAAKSINMPPTSFAKHLNLDNSTFEFKYLDENLNKESIKRRDDRDLLLGYRKIKNIKTKTSKFLGVCWNKDKNKWTAAIRIEGKKKHLGHFILEEDAGNAYLVEWNKIREQLKLNKQDNV
jgi:hypothetical protein